MPSRKSDDVVKVKVIKEFALPGQGWYREGEEVTLLFERRPGEGIITRERYKALLKLGKIELIKEKEVQNGDAL